MIWNESRECMSRDELMTMQSARLRKLVSRVYHNVEYYRKKMQEVGLEPGDIRGVEDISKLPYTTKDDLRDTYPFGLFAVPMSEIVRIHASSGTTGKATVVGYTRYMERMRCPLHHHDRVGERRHHSGGLRLRPFYRWFGRPLRRRASGSHCCSHVNG